MEVVVFFVGLLIFLISLVGLIKPLFKTFGEKIDDWLTTTTTRTVTISITRRDGTVKIIKIARLSSETISEGEIKRIVTTFEEASSGEPKDSTKK